MRHTPTQPQHWIRAATVVSPRQPFIFIQCDSFGPSPNLCNEENTRIPPPAQFDPSQLLPTPGYMPTASTAESPSCSSGQPTSHFVIHLRRWIAAIPSGAQALHFRAEREGDSPLAKTGDPRHWTRKLSDTRSVSNDLHPPMNSLKA